MTEYRLSLRENDQYSVIFRHFVLDSFRSQLIDNTTLQKISNDFSVARQAFFKLVIRFSYTTTLTNPRNDAPKLIILQHLTQLAPILNENSDVILAVQHGFIGTWGEGYYTLTTLVIKATYLLNSSRTGRTSTMHY